jgi:hypothetical protein
VWTTSVGSPAGPPEPAPPWPCAICAARRAPLVPARRNADAPIAPAPPSTTGTPTAEAAVSGSVQNCCSNTAPPNPAVAPPANPWSEDRASPIPRARVNESTSKIAPPTPNAVAPAPAAVVNGLRPSMQT